MNEFIILEESEFMDEVQAEEPTQVELLDEEEVTNLVEECIIYGKVLVRDSYVEAVCATLEDCGYQTCQLPYSTNFTYITI